MEYDASRGTRKRGQFQKIKVAHITCVHSFTLKFMCGLLPALEPATQAKPGQNIKIKQTKKRLKQSLYNQKKR